MVQIMVVDSQLSINGLLGLHSNLDEGIWKVKVGKASSVAVYIMSILRGRLHCIGFILPSHCQ